jgi:hypothetical protein
MHMDSLCTYRIYELTNFIKKSEKIHTYSFYPTPSVYKIYMQMEYDRKNMYNLFRFFLTLLVHVHGMCTTMLCAYDTLPINKYPLV